MYLVVSTSFDILYHVSKLARKMHAPNERDLGYAYQIMRYLRHLQAIKFTYKRPVEGQLS